MYTDPSASRKSILQGTVFACCEARFAEMLLKEYQFFKSFMVQKVCVWHAFSGASLLFEGFV